LRFKAKRAQSENRSQTPGQPGWHGWQRKLRSDGPSKRRTPNSFNS